MASQHILASLLMTGLILLALSTGTPLPDKLDKQMNYTAAMRSMGLEGRIAGGSLADLENIKYQVSVRRKDWDTQIFGSGHICGGSLIKPQVVLSSSTCFQVETSNVELKIPIKDSSEFMVAMGILDLFDREYTTHYTDLLKIVMPTQSIEIENLKDIALLFLKNPVPPHLKHIQPIKLNDQPVPDGTMCRVSGWGYVAKDEPLEPAKLRYVDVPFISRMTCIRDSEYKLLLPGMICAGYMQPKAGMDACYQDTGGPLVCNDLLTGIVSEPVCGESNNNNPSIYTDVLHYKRWIEDNIDAFYRKNSSHRLNIGRMYLFALLCHITSYF